MKNWRHIVSIPNFRQRLFRNILLLLRFPRVGRRLSSGDSPSSLRESSIIASSSSSTTISHSIPIPIHLAAATIYTADKSTVPFRYWKSLIPIIRMLSLCLNHNNVQWDVPNFVFATNFILILTYYSYSFILRLDTPWRLSQSAIHCIEQPSSPMNYHQHDPP